MCPSRPQGLQGVGGHLEVDIILLLLQLFPLASMALGICFFLAAVVVSNARSLAL